LRCSGGVEQPFGLQALARRFLGWASDAGKDVSEAGVTSACSTAAARQSVSHRAGRVLLEALPEVRSGISAQRIQDRARGLCSLQAAATLQKGPIVARAGRFGVA
jgi:hypothetical protein